MQLPIAARLATDGNTPGELRHEPDPLVGRPGAPPRADAAGRASSSSAANPRYRRGELEKHAHEGGYQRRVSGVGYDKREIDGERKRRKEREEG